MNQLFANFNVNFFALLHDACIGNSHRYIFSCNCMEECCLLESVWVFFLTTFQPYYVISCEFDSLPLIHTTFVSFGLEFVICGT